MGEVETAWLECRDYLCDALGALGIDGVLLVDIAEQDRADGAVPYVHAIRRAEGLWAEASSNHYLSSEFHLDDDAHRQMLALGFNPPGEVSPNYWVALHLGEAAQLAGMFVAALRDVFGVEDPSRLFEDEELEGPAKPEPVEPTLFVGGEDASTGAQVTVNEARRSIDDLVAEAWQYRSSLHYRELLDFVGGFRFQAPFNALLLHIQRPGASFVASAHRWRSAYGRQVKPGERPQVVLRTFGPVMFVYDVSQTEPDPDSLQLPGMAAAPFAMPSIAGVEDALRLTVENAKHDGVRVTAVVAGALLAGCIRESAGGATEVQVRRRPPAFDRVPVRYDVEYNSALSTTEVYATVAHELGHLYCGHVGTPNPKWWPNRRGTAEVVREFEAESVAYLACKRLDSDARMPPHLEQYLGLEPQVPEGVSLDRILMAAGRVIQMAQSPTGRRRRE